MGVVYAINDCAVAWSQGQSTIVKGDVWDTEADLVKERPDLFSNTPTLVHGRKARVENSAPVETATAAPGEKRTYRKIR